MVELKFEIDPWVVSYQPDNNQPADYLKPEDEGFYKLSLKHITEKFRDTRKKELPEDMISLTPSQKYKRSGFLIKPETPQETRVVGNIFDFELTAPLEVHQMVWNAGISEKSTLGFGWLEVAKKNE